MAQNIYYPDADYLIDRWTEYPAFTLMYEDVLSNDGDTSYIYAGPVGLNGEPYYYCQIDDPGIELDGEVINWIEVWGISKRVGTLSGMRLTIHNGVTANRSAIIPLTTLYAFYSNRWTVNPFTGLAFTKADIISLKIGINKTNTANTTRCTQLYLLVDHSLAPAVSKKTLLDGCIRPQA